MNDRSERSSERPDGVSVQTKTSRLARRRATFAINADAKLATTTEAPGVKVVQPDRRAWHSGRGMPARPGLPARARWREMREARLIRATHGRVTGIGYDIAWTFVDIIVAATWIVTMTGLQKALARPFGERLTMTAAGTLAVCLRAIVRFAYSRQARSRAEAPSKRG